MQHLNMHQCYMQFSCKCNMMAKTTQNVQEMAKSNYWYLVTKYIRQIIAIIIIMVVNRTVSIN